MKKSRFTESQIVGILKEADTGVAVNEIWRKHGISVVAPIEPDTAALMIGDRHMPACYA
jgi:hypothetical protein